MKRLLTAVLLVGTVTMPIIAQAQEDTGGALVIRRALITPDRTRVPDDGQPGEEEPGAGDPAEPGNSGTYEMVAGYVYVISVDEAANTTTLGGSTGWPITCRDQGSKELVDPSLCDGMMLPWPSFVTVPTQTNNIGSLILFDRDSIQAGFNGLLNENSLNIFCGDTNIVNIYDWETGETRLARSICDPSQLVDLPENIHRVGTVLAVYDTNVSGGSVNIGLGNSWPNECRNGDTGAYFSGGDCDLYMQQWPSSAHVAAQYNGDNSIVLIDREALQVSFKNRIKESVLEDFCSLAEHTVWNYEVENFATLQTTCNPDQFQSTTDAYEWYFTDFAITGWGDDAVQVSYSIGHEADDGAAKCRDKATGEILSSNRICRKLPFPNDGMTWIPATVDWSTMSVSFNRNDILAAVPSITQDNINEACNGEMDFFGFTYSC